MSKRKKYHPRPATAPMLVIRQTIPEISISERLSIEAFLGGYADTDSFDNLADCRDLMALTSLPEIEPIIELGYVALRNIQLRHQETGKMGATGEEIKALLAMVDFSDDFWARQSGTVFAEAWQKLKGARRSQKHG
jgi:hypothetical protein